MPDDCVVAKLDFKNAFNSVRRDCMLEAVLSEVPEIYNFCHLAYNDSSILKFGEHSVWSAMGPQQGDPLGPLLFCLTIQPILNSLRSNLTVSFLDDLTLGGPEFIVADDVNSIIRQAASVGLELNVQKCEIICSPMKVLQEEIFGDFIRFTLPQATLLGAPLFKGSAMDEMLNSRCEDLRRAVARLKMLSAHDALLMLKSAISAPKVLYIMRASPCFNHPSLQLFDDLLREGLSSSANIIVSDLAWLQASLQSRMEDLVFEVWSRLHHPPIWPRLLVRSNSRTSSFKTQRSSKTPTFMMR